MQDARNLLLIVALSLLLSGTLFPADPLFADEQLPTRAQVEFFEKKIRPVLAKHCYKCHSSQSKSVKGSLLLDSRHGMRTGGDSGAAVSPGDPDDSLLLEALRYDGLEMPPAGKLPDGVIANFEKWIEMGAPDPRDSKGGLIQRQIDFEAGRKFWAFQQPERHDPPAVKSADWPRQGLDRFVLARLEAEGLRPVADADPRTLVRRLYFDLVGLPPAPEEIEAYARDPSPAALAGLVDRLLDSPQFGERWGRHWLDVARYAESNGRERNFLYPHAWRYRDYVIRALNDDKPYDQFIREQVAGDLLAAAEADTDPSHADEMRVATGFLAIGPKSLNEKNREKFLMDIVDEQIDVTTRTVMAFTVSCARCHDHKFDPVPTSEYYSLAGIFRSTNTLFGRGGKGGKQASGLMTLVSGEEGDAEQQRQAHQARVRETTEKLKEATEQLKKWQRTARLKKGQPRPADLPGSSPQFAAKQLKNFQEQTKRLRKQLQQIKKQGPEPRDVAMGVTDGNASDCRICIRGEVENRADEAPRGYLTILSPASPPRVEASGSGRLELAGWLTSPENPLTARVMANRAWHHLFGHGIVRTVDNFGNTGDRPTHPELLDYLAVEFMEQGWSVKQLIRTIVTSRTYGLASAHDETNYERDPDNLLVWRMNSRRLDAESLRDAMLAASGQLDLTPAEESVVAGYSSGQGIGRGVQSDDFQKPSRHRSVYLPIVRNAVPNMLKVFDFAEPSIIVGRRDVTTVPAQALYLMNSPLVIEQSLHTARRLLADESAVDGGDRAELAYLLVLSRRPSDDERARAVRFVARTLETLPAGDDEREAAAWSGLCQALFASAEFRYLE